jgi:hypothetical protein
MIKKTLMGGADFDNQAQIVFIEYTYACHAHHSYYNYVLMRGVYFFERHRGGRLAFFS